MNGMRGALIPACILVTSVVATPEAQSLPRRVRISGDSADISCVRCEIRLTKRVTLAAPDTGPQLGRLVTVAANRDQRFAVVDASRTRILIFARGGRLLSEFGRAGDGPGEFRRIAKLAFDPADSLYVFEPQRYHVFSPTLRYVRTAALPGQLIDAILRGNGRLIANMRVGSAEAVGLPLHLMSSSGIERSYGQAGQRSYDPRCVVCFGLASPGQKANDVSLTRQNRPAWEVWRDDGTLLEMGELDVAWFRPWRDSGDWMSGKSARPPALLQILTADNGQLWMRVARSNPAWKPGSVPLGKDIVVAPTGGLISRRPGALDEFAERLEEASAQTVLVVIDSARRRVVTMRAIPGNMAFLRWPLAVTRRTDPNGLYVFDISAVSVVHPSPGQLSGRLRRRVDGRMRRP